MRIEEGNSYKDRRGVIWNCYQHSVYDEGWSWCRDSSDNAPGLFYSDGSYTITNKMPFDLIEDLGPTTQEHEAEMLAHPYYTQRGYMAAFWNPA